MFRAIIVACDGRYREQRHGKKCSRCTYEGYCPDNLHECGKCLELVHFPDRVSVFR